MSHEQKTRRRHEPCAVCREQEKYRDKEAVSLAPWARQKDGEQKREQKENKD
jgi:hypothetical protein